MIKAVIFDAGGVLVDISWAQKYREHLASMANRPQSFVHSHIRAKGLVRKFELGLITENEFEYSMKKIFNIKKGLIRQLNYYKKHFKLKKDVIALAKKVHGKYTTGFLSNVDVPKYIYTRKQIPNFNEIFDYKFASCYLHMRKPEKKLYRYVLKKMKLQPEETVFIDDLIDNIEAAKSVGMHTIHFTNLAQVKRELKKLGVKA